MTILELITESKTVADGIGSKAGKILVELLDLMQRLYLTGKAPTQAEVDVVTGKRKAAKAAWGAGKAKTK